MTSLTNFVHVALAEDGDANEAAMDRFDCGQSDLNRFLVRTARFNQQIGLGQAWILKPGSKSTEVSGYLTMSIASFGIDELPPRLRRRFRALATGRIAVPLIARLAIDRKFQRMGLGARMLTFAICNYLEVYDRVGGPFLGVHPKDSDAVRYYEQFGFTPTLDNEFMILRRSQAERLVNGGH